VLAIDVPPLRARRGDILPLCAHFLTRLGPVHGKPGAAINPTAQKLLESYDWPGNARELKNSIEHALVFAKVPLLGTDDFPEIVRAAGRVHDPAAALQSLEDLERQAIRATLEATHYKIGQAANILGISRKTLLDKRKKYGLV
jgi:DNA-binding NtrC family response regulator